MGLPLFFHTFVAKLDISKFAKHFYGRSSEMQNAKEIARINHFLHAVLPIVAEIVRTILQSLGYKVYQKGIGRTSASCS